MTLNGENIRRRRIINPVDLVMDTKQGYLTQTEEETSWLIKHLIERTQHLERSNQEMESFNYTVSHDLRAPLRHINGFSLMLLEDHLEKLDARGQELLRKICSESRRMEIIIEDILNLSRINRAELKAIQINLGDLAAAVATMLKETEPERDVDFQIDTSLTAKGDLTLLRILMENLIGNAWKFTSKHRSARIEIGKTEFNDMETFFVRDNGIGFDMADADRLYVPFQRLHTAGEYEGNGIGLSTVQRIVQRHRGMVWADAEQGSGATFYFTLSL